MKQFDISRGILFFSIVLLLGVPSAGFAATMTDYCQVPPFIGTGGEPNVLIVNDVSGSMGWSAYGTSGSSSAPPDSDYVSTKGYEGYFDPVKEYVLVGGIYSEATATTAPCVTTCIASACKSKASKCSNADKYGSGSGAFGCTGNYGCCTDISTSGNCGSTSGNYLNYKNMHRIDLLRWALTGGSPSTCTADAFSIDDCEPELWNEPGNSSKVGSVCNDSLDVNGDGAADGGCILKADNGTEVKVRKDRVYAGLAYQLKDLQVKPRLGTMSFSENGIRANKVFLGDFLASNSNSETFPYKNFITHINSVKPNGSTPTGPAMWDALNYYSMRAPLYGGFAEQSGAGDRWKNPLYICDGGGGNNCILNACARNYVLLMSDGEWNTPSSEIGSSPTCTATDAASQSADPLVPAYCMHKGFVNTMDPTDSTDNVSTKVNAVYTIGLFMNSTGLKAMKNTAMYGGFENSAQAWPGSLTGFPTNSNGSLGAALPASSPDWDSDYDNVPDTFFSADDALAIKQKIMDALQSMLSRATSGTAASVLASGEGSGANLVQATYYPKRKFFSSSIYWTGGLQNLWYYIDPRFASSSIREEDGVLDADGARVLTLKTDGTNHDYITQFFFDVNDQKAKARRFTDANGDGSVVTMVDEIEFESLGNLWEAGKLLWNRSAADRVIYTPLSSSATLTANANKFSTSNVAALRPLLNTDNASVSAADNTQLATNVINWVRGDDITDHLYSGMTVTETYRPRKVTIDLNGNNNASDTSVVVSGVTMNESVAKEWKLGDIIDSTPRISSWVQLNGYDSVYGDSWYKSFVSSATYTNRGMVYVGANDGMLHAFKLGTLELKWTGQDTAIQKARLKGTDLGKEMWAFIPKNVLPYLKYLKDTEYCHIQSVDLTPYLFDASIEAPGIPVSGNYWDLTKTVNSWRTILIGGMKLGGACRNSTDTTCTNCVKTPIPGVGYSSYFALDVTDQNNPQLLWEFSDETLGFTTSGPSIVRINSRTDSGSTSTANGRETNGRFFVVFGSGPTGPIDGASQKFQGRSDQPLRLFVLDLKTGSPLRTINTGILNAFAGSLLNSNFDLDLDYQDDAVYIPYVKKCTATTDFCTANTWTDGGVLRLLTNEDLDGNIPSGNTALNPDKWLYSKVIDGIGPVTSSVTRILDKKTSKLRLYFGTGRYFFRSSVGTDDPDTRRNIFGIVEPCFVGSAYTGVCLDSDTGNDSIRTYAQLGNVVLTTTAGSSDEDGWYITLDAPGTFTYDENGNGVITDDVARVYNAERIITDPLATSTGIVYFTSYMPYNDLCSIGGKTFIWAVKYDNGAAAGSLLQGTALIQVSTGSIEQVQLSTAFTDKSGRRTGAIEGVPPTAQGLSIMTTPPPVKKVLHVRER